MQEAWDLLAKAFQLDLERLQREWRRDATEIRMGIGRPIRVRKGAQKGFCCRMVMWIRTDGARTLDRIRPGWKRDWIDWFIIPSMRMRDR